MDKQQDVQFLTEQFDLPPIRAAGLVAASEAEAQQLAARQRDIEKARDPLEDKPVPVSPEEHDVSQDGGLQKPVLHRQNDRGLAGP